MEAVNEVFIILDPHTETQLEQLKKRDDRIEHLLRVLVWEGRNRGERLMAEIDNLNTNIAALTAAVDALAAKPAPAPAPTGVDPVAVQTAADAVAVQTARIDTIVAAP